MAIAARSRAVRGAPRRAFALDERSLRQGPASYRLLNGREEEDKGAMVKVGRYQDARAATRLTGLYVAMCAPFAVTAWPTASRHNL